MSSRKTNSAARKRAYKVGNGCPPLETRFKPGQSGNPLGRPKGSVSLKSAYARAASAVTDVPGVSGGEREFTLMEALMINLFRDALRGKASAVKRLLELAREFPADGEEASSDVREIRLCWQTAEEAEAS